MTKTLQPLQAETLIKATLYFHELFKKTILVTKAEYPLTKTQMDIMMALHIQECLSMKELSNRVGIAPEQATRAVKSLREEGLVQTQHSEENRRVVIAQLTNKGLLMMDEYLLTVDANLFASLDGLNEEELEELSNSAKTLVSLMDKTGLRYVVPQA